jgi:hypothetical protein
MHNRSCKVHKRRNKFKTCKNKHNKTIKKHQTPNRKTRRFRKKRGGIFGLQLIPDGVKNAVKLSVRKTVNAVSSASKLHSRSNNSDFGVFKNNRICNGNEQNLCTRDATHSNVVQTLCHILYNQKLNIKIINERYNEARLKHSKQFRNYIDGVLFFTDIKKKKNNEVFDDIPHKLPYSNSNNITENLLKIVTYEKNNYLITASDYETKYKTNTSIKGLYNLVYSGKTLFYEKRNLVALKSALYKQFNENNAISDTIGNYVDVYISIFFIEATKNNEALYIAYDTICKNLDDQISELDQQIEGFNKEINNLTTNFDKLKKEQETVIDGLNKEIKILDIDNNGNITDKQKKQNKINKIVKENYQSRIANTNNSMETELNNYKKTKGDQEFKKKTHEDTRSDLKTKLKEIKSKQDELLKYPNLIPIPTINNNNDPETAKTQFYNLTKDIFIYHDTIKDYQKYTNDNKMEDKIFYKICESYASEPIYKNNHFVIVRLYHDITLGGTKSPNNTNLFFDYTIASKISDTYTRIFDYRNINDIYNILGTSENELKYIIENDKNATVSKLNNNNDNVCGFRSTTTCGFFGSIAKCKYDLFLPKVLPSQDTTKNN